LDSAFFGLNLWPHCVRRKGFNASKSSRAVHEKIHSKWRWFGLSFSNKVSDARGNPFSYGFSLAEIAKNLKDEWVP